jgi:CBS domain containing-hemolysin-like protein
MTVLILSVVFTLSVSFLCSLLEAVILSVPTTYIEVAAQSGRSYALRLQKLKADIDRPLAAVLTMNTIANTLGSVLIGTQVDDIWGDRSLAIFSAVFTMLVLIFGEIVPKTLGASQWKLFAPFAGYAISGMVFISYPVVKLAELIASLVGAGHIHKMTKEEMIVTAEMGASHGTLNKKETTIIRNLLMLETMYASDIMTPKSVMMALDWNLTVGDVMKTIQPIRFSRIPVYSKDIDHIEGFIHRYKIMEAYSNDKDQTPIKDLMLPIHSVPESITVSAVLDQLIHRNEHIFVVINEYGSTLGIVTLEDAIETLLGVEIVDEFDSVVDMRQYALEKWKKRKSERAF